MTYQPAQFQEILSGPFSARSVRTRGVAAFLLVASLAFGSDTHDSLKQPLSELQTAFRTHHYRSETGAWNEDLQWDGCTIRWRAHAFFPDSAAPTIYRESVALGDIDPNSIRASVAKDTARSVPQVDFRTIDGKKVHRVVADEDRDKHVSFPDFAFQFDNIEVSRQAAKALRQAVQLCRNSHEDDRE